MIDRLKFKLIRENISIENWNKHFEEISYIPKEIKYANNNSIIRTCILENGTKFTLSDNSITFNNSLTKYLKGSNIHNMKPHEIKQAFEKISEDLQIDIGNAIVSNAEIGLNVKTDYTSKVYFPYLWSKDRCDRLVQPSSLYFKNGSRKIIIYDKLEEQKRKKKKSLYSTEYNLTRIECKINNIKDFLAGEIPTINNFCKPRNLLNYLYYLHSEYENIKKTYYNTNCTINISSPKDYFKICSANYIITQGIEKLDSDINLLKDLNKFEHANQYSRIKKKANDLILEYSDKNQVTIISELNNRFDLLINEYIIDIEKMN